MTEQKTLLRTPYGSHLYGTNLPTSDQDFKVVYLPTLESLLMGESLRNKVAQTNDGGKNTNQDTDTEFISLHTFVNDFVAGQTYALELAFCPETQRIMRDLGSTHSFRQLVETLRTECLTKNVSAMVGYCLGQARKYSEKGNRYNAVVAVRAQLKDIDLNETKMIPRRLGNYKSEVAAWLQGAGKEHAKHVKFETDEEGREFLVVLDAKFNLHLKMGEVFDRLHMMKKQYGNRAKEAAEFQGADWKALMHACRVVWEAEELLTTHKLTLPFTGEKRDFLLRVRQGQVPFEEVQKFLDEKVELVTKLRDESTLPTTDVVRPVARELLLNFLRKEYGLTT